MIPARSKSSRGRWAALCAVGVMCASAIAAASPAAGKAANTRGMALMGQKKWTEAEAAFQQAIAADPTSVLAHYNLACAAARAAHADTAFAELAWVGDRAGWDDQAKAAAKKAASDEDLAELLGANIDAQAWVGDAVLAATTEIATPSPAAIKVTTARPGQALVEPSRGQVLAIFAAAHGKRDAQCDPASDKQGKVFGLDLATGAWAKGVGAATLGDGVAVIDAKGAIVARSEPLGCTAPGESQDQLAALAYADGVPVAAPKSVAQGPDLPLLAAMYTTGGRREWQTTVAVFAPRGKALIKVFEGVVAASDATSAGHVWHTPLGQLVYAAPGDSKKHVFRWDGKAFKFVAAP